MTGRVKMTVFVLLVVLVGQWSCAPLSQVSRTLGQVNLISVEDEVSMGEQLAVEVEKERPLLMDAEIPAYVSEVGHGLASQIEPRRFNYTFKVVDEPDVVNAFALPGAHIYVHSGLLLAADNEAELASVLCHEMGHAVARHSTRRMTQIYGFRMLSRLALGEDPEPYANLASNLFGQLGILSFSREDELEADALGMRLLYNSGYNTRAMVTFLQKLRDIEQREPSSIEILLRTHPAVSERFQRATELLYTYSPMNGRGLFERRYKQRTSNLE